MTEKCPICGGDIILGECPDCGFEPPDYSEIAAPYDLDPSNDRFGESDSIDGLFPSAESVDTAAAELDIPSVSMPSIRLASVSYGKYASAGIKPIPNIKAGHAVQSAQSVQPPVQTVPTKTSGTQFVSSGQQNLGQNLSLPERFVKGTVNFVLAHWWKFLIMAVMPSAGILFMGFCFVKYRTDHRISDLLTAILYGFAAAVMLVNGWDPFGLDKLLLELLDLIFGSRSRRRGYY